MKKGGGIGPDETLATCINLNEKVPNPFGILRKDKLTLFILFFHYLTT